MPFDFTGTATWRALISGPADTEAVTGISVTDMGVLLADRTLFLYDAFASGFVVQHGGSFSIQDVDSDYNLIETHNTGSWSTSPNFTFDVDILPDDRLITIVEVNATALTANFAEFRISFDAIDAGGVPIPPSAHVLIHTGGTLPQGYSLTHLTGPIESDGSGGPICKTTLEARVDMPPSGSVTFNGSAEFHVLRLRPHH
ncbi:hypothetical protein LCGC14_2739280 [marine sediment metagenome]|uniref:Uncharacterized protein n=1 Tax=marine sediment metagenome TaxID=412755 RepID=A0A0F8Z4X8_9ZZZZ